MTRAALTLLTSLATVTVADAARATDFRHPSTCHAGCMMVTAYYDNGGVKDWNCGGVSYSGHKGTDLGPYGGFTAMDEGRDVVAAADGEVTYAHDGEFDRCTSGSCAGGSGFGNWVKLKHADGKETIYGHLRKGTVTVSVGQKVTCGQKLGQIGSSGFSTGAHLHFEPRVAGVAKDPFKGSCSGSGPFWVEQGAYKALPATKCEATSPPPPPPNQAPKGNLDSADCDEIVGWAQDPDAKTKGIEVHLYFDGEAGSGAKATRVVANLSRADLCGPLGSCEHGFVAAPPAAMKDGRPHTVFAYGIDTAGGENPKLAGSPKSFQCEPPEPDAGTSDGGVDPATGAQGDASSPRLDAEVAPAAADDDGALQGSCSCRAAGGARSARREAPPPAFVAWSRTATPIGWALLGVAFLRRRRR